MVEVLEMLRESKGVSQTSWMRLAPRKNQKMEECDLGLGFHLITRGTHTWSLNREGKAQTAEATSP